MAMEPAKSIIKKLGGEAEVSRITGTALTAPYRWQHARSKGGTDGRIPQKHISVLLNHARNAGIDLTLNDFFAGNPLSTEQSGVAA
jgi:hypothetical protein